MKSLGGWWRLWFVVSILCVGSAIAISLATKDLEEKAVRSEARKSNYTPEGCVPGTVSLQETDAWAGVVEFDPNQPVRVPPPEGFVLEVDDDNFELVARCTSWLSVGAAIAYALVCSIILLIVGLTLRWIYRGFRKQAD